MFNKIEEHFVRFRRNFSNFAPGLYFVSRSDRWSIALIEECEATYADKVMLMAFCSSIPLTTNA